MLLCVDDGPGMYTQMGVPARVRFDFHEIIGGCLKLPKVILVDDCPEAVEVCAELLKQDYDVVGIASDGESAIELCIRVAPDVVVLDIHSRLDGIEMAKRLRDCGCRAVFIFLSAEENLVTAALQKGVGFVSKILIGQDLRIGIREVLAGRIFVSRIA